jgi:hypothetical protein
MSSCAWLSSPPALVLRLPLISPSIYPCSHLSGAPHPPLVCVQDHARRLTPSTTARGRAHPRRQPRPGRRPSTRMRAPEYSLHRPEVISTSEPRVATSAFEQLSANASALHRRAPMLQARLMRSGADHHELVYDAKPRLVRVRPAPPSSFPCAAARPRHVSVEPGVRVAHAHRRGSSPVHPRRRERTSPSLLHPAPSSARPRRRPRQPHGEPSPVSASRRGTGRCCRSSWSRGFRDALATR